MGHYTRVTHTVMALRKTWKRAVLYDFIVANGGSAADYNSSRRSIKRRRMAVRAEIPGRSHTTVARVFG
jgi:hypothetical protein